MGSGIMTGASDLPVTGPQSPDLSLFFFFLSGVEKQTGFFLFFFDAVCF